MKHFGDITRLSGYDLPAVDVITGGSPCQDLSVAGKREGLAGERSGLFMEQIRIVKEMRERDIRSGRTAFAARPRFMVWENVPGAFSSNKGADFQSVLTEIIRIVEPKSPDVPMPNGGKWPHAGCLYDAMARWSLAWRVHDAQFWGVPQRRKRIALVTDFGGLAAPEILFEREGVSGDIEQGGETREETAGSAGESLNPSVARSLTARMDGSYSPDRGPDVVVQGYDAYQHHGYRESETVNPLTAGQNDSVRGDTPLVCYGIEPGAAKRLNTEGRIAEEVSPTLHANAGDNQAAVCYGISSYDSNAMKSSNPHSGIYEAETARTLDNNGGNPACNQGGIAVVYDAVGITSPVNASNPAPGGPCHTLHSGAGNSIVCIEGNGSRESHKGDGYKESEVMYTLNSVEQHAVCFEPRTLDGNGGNPSCNQGGMAVVALEGNGARPSHKGSGYSEDNVSFTLNATEQHGVAYGIDRATYNMGQNAQFGIAVEEEVEPTMVAKGPGAVAHPVYTTSKSSYHTEAEEDVANTLVATDYKDPPTISEEPYYIVRRLTPTECARLQGFPDGWTLIGEPEEVEVKDYKILYDEDGNEVKKTFIGTHTEIEYFYTDEKGKKKKCSDSARYKALGNSIALPFWEWMAKRMAKYLPENATMGSLFDGISGFPLVYQRAGVTPVWASEIEEFPMAVAKIRFPE